MIVDDQAVVRRGLRGFLDLLEDIAVIGEAENGRLAEETAARLNPDVILMDLLMPELDGIGAIDIPDPAEVEGTGAERLAAFETTLADLAGRIEAFMTAGHSAAV